VKDYLLTVDAERDIDSIKIHLLEQGGPALVRHVLRQLETSFQFLGSMPGVGHGRTDLTDASVKFWRVFLYLVIYDPAPSPIHIVRVLHASRDLQAMLRG
jgi:plasmid stabilization system protein ParE